MTDASNGRRRVVVRVVGIIAALGLLAGGVDYLLHHYDPARILYKRLMAADRFVYDRIDPAWQTTDPATLIADDLVRDPENARQRLVRLIWGEAGFPANLRPQTVETAAFDDAIGNLPNVYRVDRLTLRMEHGLGSVFDLIHAPAPNRRLVVFHNGFGAPIGDATPLFRALLAAGYDVLAFDLIGRARNSGLARLDGTDRLFNVMSEMAAFDRPLLFHLDPVVAGINHALAGGRYRSVDMVGLSMGGFMTILAAAVDPRIERSFPVAADLPLYLRRGQEVLPGYPPYYAPLTDLVSHLDLYVLGASGRGRRQVQIFNRYDRCCYSGLRGTLYEAAVAHAVAATPAGGRFSVVLDETHADHRISEFAIDRLLTELAAGR